MFFQINICVPKLYNDVNFLCFASKNLVEKPNHDLRYCNKYNELNGNRHKKIAASHVHINKDNNQNKIEVKNILLVAQAIVILVSKYLIRVLSIFGLRIYFNIQLLTIYEINVWALIRRVERNRQQDRKVLSAMLVTFLQLGFSFQIS